MISVSRGATGTHPLLIIASGMKNVVQNIPFGAFATFPHAIDMPLHFHKPLISSTFTSPVIIKMNNNAKY